MKTKQLKALPRGKQDPLTDDFVFKCLVFTNGFPIPFTFMFFTVEIFDSFIIEQAVCMDTPGDLEDYQQLYDEEI